MGWMQKLYETYEGIAESTSACEQNGETPLVPVGFIRKEVKFHIVLRRDGAFQSAEEFPPKTQCLMPSTPQAESRTGDKGAPFPLTEQMKYLVCEENEDNPRFDKYMEQLARWSEQENAPPVLKTLWNYLSRRTILHDMTEVQKLKVKYQADDAKKLGEDAKAMVCFSVHDAESDEERLWLRADVRESWKKFLENNAAKSGGDTALCYVLGKQAVPLETHPKVQGNAKLISAKDAEYPFQYRGRFVEERSAAVISEEVSIKAHNALSWLVRRQGMTRYGITWLTWNINNKAMTATLREEYDEDEDEEGVPLPDTFEGYAEQLKRKALGLKANMESWDNERKRDVVILAMQAATDGRMSVIYYQEMFGNEYVDRVCRWHETCCWSKYIFKQKKYVVAAPTPKEITRAVMGEAALRRADEDKKNSGAESKQARQIYMHILACIADEKPLPEDILRNAFHRAVSPLGFMRDKKWDRNGWKACFDVSCALLRKHQNDNREIPGAFELETDNRNRSYLYGRLLATANLLECSAMNKNGEYQSNAIRLMQKYVQRPYETWKELHTALLPYLQKLGEASDYWQKWIGQIESCFLPEDRTDKRALLPEFLHGYYCQERAIYEKMAPPYSRECWMPEANRSVLYGSLIALADWIEKTAASYEEDDITRYKNAGRTNALRMMAQMERDPARTWPRLHERLLPYMNQLEDCGRSYQQKIAQIEKTFSWEECCSTKPLEAEYLNGYYRLLANRGNLSLIEKSNEPDLPEERSVLYGRLLAEADYIEHTALKRFALETIHPTNAEKMLSVYAKKPKETWGRLKEKLTPYEKRLGNTAETARAQIQEIEKRLEEQPEETLNETYIHAYYRAMKLK